MAPPLAGASAAAACRLTATLCPHPVSLLPSSPGSGVVPGLLCLALLHVRARLLHSILPPCLLCRCKAVPLPATSTPRPILLPICCCSVPCTPCSFPFLNLFFRRLGLGERAIGALGAARPLISLPAGALWSGAADKSRRHRAVLLACFAASVAARLAIAPVGVFWAGGPAAPTAVGSDAGDTGSGSSGGGSQAAFLPLLGMVLLTEFFAAPVTIIVDAGGCQRRVTVRFQAESALFVVCSQQFVTIVCLAAVVASSCSGIDPGKA